MFISNTQETDSPFHVPSWIQKQAIQSARPPALRVYFLSLSLSLFLSSPPLHFAGGSVTLSYTCLPANSLRLFIFLTLSFYFWMIWTLHSWSCVPGLKRLYGFCQIQNLSGILSASKALLATHRLKCLPDQVHLIKVQHCQVTLFFTSLFPKPTPHLSIHSMFSCSQLRRFDSIRWYLEIVDKCIDDQFLNIHKEADQVKISNQFVLFWVVYYACQMRHWT